MWDWPRQAGPCLSQLWAPSHVSWVGCQQEPESQPPWPPGHLFRLGLVWEAVCPRFHPSHFPKGLNPGWHQSGMAKGGKF